MLMRVIFHYPKYMAPQIPLCSVTWRSVCCAFAFGVLSEQITSSYWSFKAVDQTRSPGHNITMWRRNILLKGITPKGTKMVAELINGEGVVFHARLQNEENQKTTLHNWGGYLPYDTKQTMANFILLKHRWVSSKIINLASSKIVGLKTKYDQVPRNRK